MRSFITSLFVLISISLLAQSPGDTIVVETFNYTQTHGVPWDGTIRDTMIDFPDDPDITYEKVLMLYNMRCKDGLVSNTTNRDRGCGEWDYSCNTYIHDSSRVDSVLSYTYSHYISAFNGELFEYVETPLYDFYQHGQQEVEIKNIITESTYNVGNGSLTFSDVIASENKSGKSQYLVTESELSAAGIVSGDIDALFLNITSPSSRASYFRVQMKHTEKTGLTAGEPDLDGFTEVYFYDYTFLTGDNRIQFHTPFNWDGTSNIIVEFSFTNHEESDPIAILGEVTDTVTGIVAKNGFSLESVNGKIELPTSPFSSVSDQITVSFWSYGNERLQPAHNSIVHGVDDDNNRQVNIHLPWGNSSIYWDCGNDGSGYDRINKGASPDDYEGNWSHWAFTKNSTTGDMKIYLNGALWHSGTDKERMIDISELILATSGNYDRSYFGKFSEFRVWDTELDESTIHDWMYRMVDEDHPEYASLVAYYKLDEGIGTTINDYSVFEESANIDGYLYWVYQRGIDLSNGFYETSERPNFTFAQGNYELTINEVIVTDSVKIIPNIVREYEIIPRYGTMLHDSINELSVNEYWEARYQRIYDPDGALIDSIDVTPTDEIEIEELEYFRRYPSKYEIMSFVTPYGIYLDLGMEGKTWVFDVSDYLPILNGTKRMTVERGGQWQEDMDIRFLFIVGTPPRDILDINQLWRADSKGYTDIIADRAFEPRDVQLLPDGEQFKIRLTITGHGQQGEFTPRYHFLKIDGNEEFNWRNWTECATNPIYPQGGTWIYDRAGWCPGQASDLYEYDITDLVTAGEVTNIDYGLEYANGTSNYIVNNQLVTYGGPNFNLDARVLQVLKPNAHDAKNDRFNPACTFPEVVIQNTGSITLTSLNIAYYEEGGEGIVYPWSGSLDFMEVDTVVLPISDLNFWMPTSNVFIVEVSEPNGQEDEYEHNNTMRTYFEGVDIYPESQIIKIVCKTNNYGWQTNYTLYDGEGDVYLEWDNLDNNTIYETPLILPKGCYKLQINDRADDGLTWWHNSTQGTGYLRIRNEDNNTLYNFETEFGRFAIYEFGIGEITNINTNNAEISVSVSPNPSNEFVNLHAYSSDRNEIRISLMSTLGNVVYEKAFSLSNNQLVTTLDLSQLKSGIYIMLLEQNDKTVTKKIIKK